MNDAKELESVRALRRIRELFADVDAWVVWADDMQLLEAYPGELLDHIDTLTRERDEARTTSQYWKDEKLASESAIDTLTQQRDEAREELRDLNEAFCVLNDSHIALRALTADAGCLGAPFCSKGCCGPQATDPRVVVTDAMVERASTAYRKVAAPSLRSALGVSTIRAILTAALAVQP